MQQMQKVQSFGKAQSQKGFTIIELVVVILLLGILAATALPRFMDVTDEAHAAVVDGVEGGLVTGAAMFRAQWIAEGQPLTTAPDFGGGELLASATGYPSGSGVLAGALTGSARCELIYNELLQSGRPEVADVAEAGIAATTGAGTAAAQFSHGGVSATGIAGADAGAAFVAVLDVAGANTGTLYCDDTASDCIANGTYYTDAGLTTPFVATPASSCNFYYVGQFREVGTTIPVLSLNLNTGAIGRDTFTIN